MTYNIHPIIIHFPVALLFLYSIIKILPLVKWLPDIHWKHIKRTLLFVGVLGAFAAILTGDTAREIMQPDTQLVEAHENFAYLSAWLYGLLLLGEIASVAKSQYSSKIHSKMLQTCMTFIEKVLCNGVVSKLLAFFGLIAISVTGLLGGVMVYGPSADPLAGIVLKILGIDL